MPSQTLKGGLGKGDSDLPLALEPLQGRQEVFALVVSVCLTRHYTQIWPLEMLLLKGLLAKKKKEKRKSDPDSETSSLLDLSQIEVLR